MVPQIYVWLSMLLFLLGIAALILEIFILPGFGISGVAGIILITWGVLLLAVDFTQATMALVVALLATLVVFLLSLKLLKRFNIWQRLTLGTKQQKETGYVAPQANLVHYIGKTGVAVTPLRPSGVAEVIGQRLDVVTEGDYISAGTPIEVIQVEGARVVVKTLSSRD